MELFNAVVFVFLILFCLLALAFILEAATAHRTRAENRRLYEQNEDLKTDTLELAAKYLNALNVIEEHEAQAAQLTNRNRELFIHNHNLLNAVCEAEEQADSLYNDLCRLAEAEKQNDELRQRLAARDAEITAYLDKIYNLELNEDANNEAISDLEAEINALEYDLEEALEQVRILEDECSALQEDLENALDGLDEDADLEEDLFDDFPDEYLEDFPDEDEDEDE